MPIYEYEHEKEAPKSCENGQRFEVVQSFSDEALTQCPACKASVQRVFSSLSIHGAGSSTNRLSNKNLAEKGFTKYVKAGDGHYEKTAGKGPKVIKR